MDMFEFGKKCQQLNRQYRQLFGSIPSPVDYACTREQFLEALEKSIETQQTIDHFLDAAALPDPDMYKY